MNELTMLLNIGCKQLKEFKEVNNYGYIFIFKDVKYTLEHVLNVYGESVDFWDLNGKGFETINEVIDYLMEI